MESKPFTPCVSNSRIRADLIRQAEKQVIYCSPGITALELDALLQIRSRTPLIQVRVLVDFNAEAFRAGYWGEQTSEQIVAISRLGSTIEIAQGLRLGLLIVDAQAFIFTPTAQGIEAEVRENSEPNALRLDADETRRLIISIVTEKPTGAPQRPIVSEEKVMELQAEIKAGNPITPQKQRMLEILRQRVKIIQFEIRGYQIGRRRLDLPQKVIEILGSERDEINERLSASWRLFKNDSVDKALAEQQNALENDLAKLKKDHLQRLGHYGYGLLESFKPDFEKAWISFQKERVEVYRNTLKEKVGAMITGSQDLLRDLLRERVNSGRLDVPSAKTLFKKSKEEEVNNYIERLVQMVKWPKPEEISKEVVVKLREYDITLGLLEDKEFVGELEKALEFNLEDLLKQSETQHLKVTQPFPFSIN